AAALPPSPYGRTGCVAIDRVGSPGLGREAGERLVVAQADRRLVGGRDADIRQRVAEVHPLPAIPLHTERVAVRFGSTIGRVFGEGAELLGRIVPLHESPADAL